MLNTLLGQKKNMSQTFVGDTRVPVTYVKLGPCIVTGIKTKERDGYWAVQIGFGEKSLGKVTKPVRGHLKPALKNLLKGEKKLPRYLREVRLDKEPDVKVGDIIKVSDVFKKGDLVMVTGVSKGKGFAGVIKRWGFAGGPRTHGQSDRQRSPGSIGQGTTPGRVHKGKKMPGRMGSDRGSVKNLLVVAINPEENEIALSGPIPGSRNSLVVIKKIGAGKLSDLIEETPQVQVQKEVEGEGETEEKENKGGENESGEVEKVKDAGEKKEGK